VERKEKHRTRNERNEFEGKGMDLKGGDIYG